MLRISSDVIAVRGADDVCTELGSANEALGLEEKGLHSVITRFFPRLIRHPEIDSVLRQTVACAAVYLLVINRLLCHLGNCSSGARYAV